MNVPDAAGSMPNNPRDRSLTWLERKNNGRSNEPLAQFDSLALWQPSEFDGCFCRE